MVTLLANIHENWKVCRFLCVLFKDLICMFSPRIMKIAMGKESCRILQKENQGFINSFVH